MNIRWDTSRIFHANLHQRHQKKETSPAKSPEIHKLKGSEKTESIPQKSPSCVEFLNGCWHPRIRGCFHPPRPLASPSFNQLRCLRRRWFRPGFCWGKPWRKSSQDLYVATMATMVIGVSPPRTVVGHLRNGRTSWLISVGY